MIVEKGKTSSRNKPSPIDVWIVEDNSLYRKSFTRLINGTKGMICSNEFSHAEPALRKIATGDAPDVCLLDIGLPGMNGIECVSKIKSHHVKTQIIMITVFDDNDHIFDALCAGASGYLLKASTKETIINAITDVMEGGSPMNPSIARKVVTAFTHLRNPTQELILTPREKEILTLMSKGLTNKEISQTLTLSHHTIDTHVRNIYEKLQVHTRLGAISKMMQR